MMNLAKIARRRSGIVAELFSFLWNNQGWWMLPMITVLVLFAVLLILAESSAIAPFIYTLFLPRRPKVETLLESLEAPGPSDWEFSGPAAPNSSLSRFGPSFRARCPLVCRSAAHQATPGEVAGPR